jgi:hypothetical protein
VELSRITSELGRVKMQLRTVSEHTAGLQQLRDDMQQIKLRNRLKEIDKDWDGSLLKTVPARALESTCRAGLSAEHSPRAQRVGEQSPCS